MPIFKHFLKRYYRNKYTILSFNRIMKFYSKMYDYANYYKKYYEDKYLVRY